VGYGVGLGVGGGVGAGVTATRVAEEQDTYTELEPQLWRTELEHMCMMLE